MSKNLLRGHTKKHVLEVLDKYSSVDRIHLVISTHLSFSLLKRDKDGNCICDGDLILDRKDIKELPENLIVNGDLWCNFNIGLTSLPKGLRVNGNLDCYDCTIESLPNDLYIIGDFNCGDNILEELPSNLYVGGDFSCRNNMVNKIPKDIYVGGNLTCSNNGLVKIPKESNIIGDIIGDIWKEI